MLYCPELQIHITTPCNQPGISHTTDRTHVCPEHWVQIPSLLLSHTHNCPQSHHRGRKEMRNHKHLPWRPTQALLFTV